MVTMVKLPMLNGRVVSSLGLSHRCRDKLQVVVTMVKLPMLHGRVVSSLGLSHSVEIDFR